MTRRSYELTDHEWSILLPLLPNRPRGVPRVDDRRVPALVTTKATQGSDI